MGSAASILAGMIALGLVVIPAALYLASRAPGGETTQAPAHVAASDWPAAMCLTAAPSSPRNGMYINAMSRASNGSSGERGNAWDCRQST